MPIDSSWMTSSGGAKLAAVVKDARPVAAIVVAGTSLHAMSVVFIMLIVFIVFIVMIVLIVYPDVTDAQK